MPIRPPAPGRHYKPATVRFYFDADVLGLAHQIAGLRPDATYPGDPGGVVLKRLRPPCPITSPSTKDRDWIPQVTGLGWLIITRDLFTALGTASGGAFSDAANRFDRAARARFQPVPRVGPVGSELRALAGQLIRAHRHGNASAGGASAALLVSLVALVREIAAWRTARGDLHQAAAARDAAQLTRRVAAEQRPALRDPRRRRASAARPSPPSPLVPGHSS